MYLIAGLGNPGRRYAQTRHNVGFMLVDRLARRSQLRFSTFLSAEVARWKESDIDAVLVKPQTYMNLSGPAVAALIRYYKVDLAECLVVYDEVALPLGQVRFRASGSSGGHKGMASVIESVGTDAVPRLRIGIAGEPRRGSLADYVLNRFRSAEASLLDEVLDRCMSGVESFMLKGIDRTMAEFNRGGIDDSVGGTG